MSRDDMDEGRVRPYGADGIAIETLDDYYPSIGRITVWAEAVNHFLMLLLTGFVARNDPAQTKKVRDAAFGRRADMFQDFLDNQRAQGHQCVEAEAWLTDARKSTRQRSDLVHSLVAKVYQDGEWKVRRLRFAKLPRDQKIVHAQPLQVADLQALENELRSLVERYPDVDAALQFS